MPVRRTIVPGAIALVPGLGPLGLCVKVGFDRGEYPERIPTVCSPLDAGFIIAALGDS